MSEAKRGDRMPPRVLPLMYLSFAHISLGAAFLVLGTQPEAIVGFFYHPRMIAVVHMVTLGWISSSILGAIYLVGPIALRMYVPARRLAYLAFVNFPAAGTFGLLVGLEKLQIHVLPGFVLDSVYAHAHLAALGWATMMVVGTGYRLFPMFLPAAMPSGPRPGGRPALLGGG